MKWWFIGAAGIVATWLFWPRSNDTTAKAFVHSPFLVMRATYTPNYPSTVGEVPAFGKRYGTLAQAREVAIYVSRQSVGPVEIVQDDTDFYEVYRHGVLERAR